MNLIFDVRNFANAPKKSRRNHYYIANLYSIKPVSNGIRARALHSVKLKLVTWRYRIFLCVQVDKGHGHKNQILWTTKTDT